MARFIVRVVLHGAKEPEGYLDLHEAMEVARYYRTIKAVDGKWYDLPPATYRAECNWTREAIRDEVKVIAASTGYRHSVFVTESNGSAWAGLDEVG